VTVEQIKASEKIMLTPRDVAEVLGMNHYNVSLIARDCPERLGFPVLRSGNRTKIPRKAFLRFLGEEG